MTGADEVWTLEERIRDLEAGLAVIRDQANVDLVLDPHRSVRMATAILAGESISDWERSDD